MDIHSASVALSWVVAISTAAYTGINLMMWIESRATRRQKITPHIIAYLKGSEDHKTLCLFFKNIGEGCAYDIRVNVLKDYNQFQKEDSPLSSLQLMKNGAAIFPPQYELNYFIDYYDALDFSNKENSYVEFEVTYSDIKKQQYKNIYTLPLDQVSCNYQNPPETYMGQIPHYLKEIKKALEK